MARHTAITWDDCEDAARYIHALYGLSLARRVSPVGLAALLAAQLEPHAPRGCRGVGLLAVPLRLYYGDEDELAHELLHVALEVIGVPPVHHPDRLVEIASPCIDVPGAHLRRFVAAHGLDAWALLREYPEVGAVRLFVRAAFAVGGVAIFHEGRRRRVFARSDDAPRALAPSEAVLVAQVRESGAPCWERGAGAWPFAERSGRIGVVVLASADGGVVEFVGAKRQA